MLEEDAAAREEAHAARRAREERRAELVLERADLPAERRLAHVEALGGAPDVAFLGDGDEVADLLQAHATRIREIETVLDRAGRRDDDSGVITIHGPREIEALRRAGRAAAETLAHVGARVCAGVTTAQIDAWVRAHTARLGGAPSQLGHQGFPASVCTSRNAVVCHGVPRDDETLEDGDLVNVDVTTMLGGFHGDTSATFVIGEGTAEARELARVARACRDAGIAVVREGARLGDVGAAIEEVARAAGVSVVREYGGHGIGRRMHMEPHVPHVGTRGAGPRLRAGMAFTVEPMVNAGGAAVRTLADGWTVVTADSSLSAQFEHTVVVTRDGCEITTLASSP